MDYTVKNDLKINANFFKFVNEEIMPGTNIEPDTFWKGFSEIANNLAP